MAVAFCAHCDVPLTKDEERRRRCPACKKPLRIKRPQAESLEPPAPDDAEPVEPPSPPAPRSWAVSLVAALTILMGVLHAAAGIVFTIQLEEWRADAHQPTRVVQKDGTVREYPPHGCVVAMATYCVPAFMALTVGIAILGVGLVFAGVGVWRRRRWARIAVFCWMILVVQGAVGLLIDPRKGELFVTGLVEVGFAVAACLVLYRNGAEFRPARLETDAE